MRKPLLVAAALAALAACTPRAIIPDADRERVHAQLAGQQRWLRVAVYAAPLWGDHTRVLLSDQPLSELELVLSPGGDVLAPPPAERIVPPATKVRIEDVEFPTGWSIARRVVMSPRYHPWVILDVPGDPRPHVIVLSQTVASFDDVRAELDRFLTRDDPSSFLSALPGEQRSAVTKKELVDGMGLRAVEMAWGLPERKKIDRPSATEEWTWPGGKRRAFFQDDHLVRWER